ncbi:SWIM zinc finger family protein [Streptomyces sp. DH10]|uniref:SWIM zinc finger family protein n=1 Tax=Streptomyces sp. DH10 TaxID=3040121 RepID=UPI0024419BC2|nr:SWIM zinc finger family protein [Streptomyces sp. DH10]MDG9712754.1 SWIM zinc finger family protein [Streptomyces sp. DH10]
MTPSPADEARRALRAARERAASDPHPAPAARPAPPSAPSPVGQEAPQPADVAREALRRAVSEHQGAGPARDMGALGDADAEVLADQPGDTPRDASGPTEPDGSDDRGETGKAPAQTDQAGTPTGEEDRPSAPTESTVTAPSGGTDRPASRAADIAREALRAARQDARRARQETEREGARRRRGTRQSRVDERAAALRRARGNTGGGEARDVGQMLSDAFRMPATDPGGTPEAPGETGHEDSPSPGPGIPDAAPAPAPPPASAPSTTPSPTPRTPGNLHSPLGPHSMAAPNRDNELRRTFPAFPPRGPDDTGFAESWWGNAWVAALEQGALDVKRLERGRGYAGQGHVDAITVTPGLVLAYVRGSRPRPYRVQVRLRTLDDQDWERFLDAAADRPGHIAALLDKEMPQSLADCGVPLLPGPGDLEPRCSCPDRGHPCKHAAALCYQTARLLDADPFVLLLLRGRGERELLDALSRLSATRAARAAQDKGPAPLPGVRASDVLTPRALPPLPAPLPPPPHPEQPPAYPASPGGPDPFALDQLATDAAARAHALLTTGRDPVGQLTLWEDAVRLAAARPGSGLTAGTRALYSSLASAAGRTPSELARAVAAWRQGGPEGLAVLEEPWDPPAGRFDRARPLLLAADLPAFRPWRNHLTHPHGHVQLRLGRDGVWYAYESEPGQEDWWPRGTPDLDPVGALTGLGMASDL